MKPFLGAFFLWVGLVNCNSSSGIMPTCDPDSTDSSGCHPFAACYDENGKNQDPVECCKELTGSELDRCLYGFGVEVNEAGGNGGSGDGG